MLIKPPPNRSEAMEEGLKLLKVALEERRSVEVTLKQLEQTLNYTLHNASLPCRISSQVRGLRWLSAVDTFRLVIVS